MKTMSQRQVRVANVVKSAVADSFARGLSLSVDAGLLSVSDVWVSPDLRQASIYISTLDRSLSGKEIEEALNAESYIFRKHVAKALSTKYTPNIRFYHDETYDNATRMENLLKQANGEKA